MGLFDSLKQQAVNALKTNGNKIGKEIGDNIKNSVKSISNKSEDITFPGVPESFEEFSAFLENYEQGQNFALIVKGLDGIERQISIAKAPCPVMRSCPIYGGIFPGTSAYTPAKRYRPGFTPG